MEVTAHLLREVTAQRSYLQRLMTLVLTNVPWLLDDVDGLPSASGEGYDDDDDEVENGNYFVDNERDDEVWC